MAAKSTIEGYRHGRVPRAVRSEQLLDAAERVFAAQGHGGASIEEIARAAKVSKPIIYEHFGSKDGIYLACVRRARQQLEAAIVAAVAETEDPYEQLARGTDAYFEFVERDPQRWAVLFGGVAVSGRTGREVLRLRAATVELIASMLQRWVPDASAERILTFAHALSGSGEQLARWWQQSPGVSRDTVVGYQVEYAWGGLRQLL